MKLRHVQTIRVYDTNDGVRFRHIEHVGTKEDWGNWQQLKYTDHRGEPWWSSNISDKLIEKLDDAIKLESSERDT
jgi:hypothetical protein